MSQITLEPAIPLSERSNTAIQDRPAITSLEKVNLHSILKYCQKVDP